MNNSTIDKITSTNQKYLKKLVGKEIPAKLEKQIEEMDWSCLYGGFANRHHLLG